MQGVAWLEFGLLSSLTPPDLRRFGTRRSTPPCPIIVLSRTIDESAEREVELSGETVSMAELRGRLSCTGCRRHVSRRF